MWRHRRNRSGFVLVELLVAVTIMAVAAALALGAWQRSEEAAALRTGMMQVAAVMRDAISTAGTGHAGGITKTVVWMCPAGSSQACSGQSTLGSTIAEWKLAGGQWVQIQPAGGIATTLPAGVTIQSANFPASGSAYTNSFTVWVGDTSTGTYEGYATVTSAGTVTLVTTHGMTGVVHASAAGTVWY